MTGWFLTMRWVKWLALFASAIGLAIALAHALNRPAPLAISTAIVFEQATTLPLQIQAKYDRQLAHYATVARADGSFRQMFIEQPVIDRIQPGTPLPDGTLIVMETWYSPTNVGTVFVKQKQNGDWQYGSFSPGQPNYQMRSGGSCHSCHAPFPETDFTLTKPLLDAALKTQRVQTSVCDRPGRTPCEAESYIPQSS